MEKIAEITGLSKEDISSVQKLRTNTTCCAVICAASDLEENEILVIFHGSSNPQKNLFRTILVYLDIQEKLGFDCWEKYEFIFLSCWGAKMPSYVMNRHLHPIKGRLTMGYLIENCVEPSIDVFEKE